MLLYCHTVSILCQKSCLPCFRRHFPVPLERNPPRPCICCWSTESSVPLARKHAIKHLDSVKFNTYPQDSYF